MRRYENKVALVSGGLGGFGLAIAQRLASEGARVVLGDVAKADATVTDGVFEAGQEPAVMTLNVTDPASWNEVTGQTVERSSGTTFESMRFIPAMSGRRWWRASSCTSTGLKRRQRLSCAA